MRQRNPGEGNEQKNTTNSEGAGRREKANEGDAVQVFRRSRRGENLGNRAG